MPWNGRTSDFTGAAFDGGDLTGVHIGSGTELIFHDATFSGGEVDVEDAKLSGGVVVVGAAAADRVRLPAADPA